MIAKCASAVYSAACEEFEEYHRQVWLLFDEWFDSSPAKLLQVATWALRKLLDP